MNNPGEHFCKTMLILCSLTSDCKELKSKKKMLSKMLQMLARVTLKNGRVTTVGLLTW